MLEGTGYSEEFIDGLYQNMLEVKPINNLQMDVLFGIFTGVIKIYYICCCTVDKEFAKNTTLFSLWVLSCKLKKDFVSLYRIGKPRDFYQEAF